MELIASLVWFGLVTWLIARAMRQNGALPKLKRIAGRDAAGLPPVCIIVPARDEAQNIGPCVRSILAQESLPPGSRVIVVDDDSRDGTADIVAALAAGDCRVRLVKAPPLPMDWTGKTHACWSGATAAPAAIEWLCFVDADMRADPPLIASALNAAVNGRIDLLSLAPRQELRSLAERLVMPCGLYILAFTQDLARVQAPDSDDAVATGQFMLMRRAAYDAVGGFAAVRNAICEDVEFARLFKRQGHKVLMQDGSALLSTRMYTGWSTLWPGFAKNLSDMLGGPARTVLIAAVAVVMAWAAVLLPAVDIAACLTGAPNAWLALAAALAGSLAAFGLHIAGAVHFRIPPWYGMLFPVGYTVGALMALDSLRWKLVRRVRWKGRVYT